MRDLSRIHTLISIEGPGISSAEESDEESAEEDNDALVMKDPTAMLRAMEKEKENTDRIMDVELEDVRGGLCVVCVHG